MEGHQPYLGDLLTMVIKHLLTGMILQVTMAKHKNQVIQAVTFLSPIVGGHRSNLWRGHLIIPKRSQRIARKYQFWCWICFLSGNRPLKTRAWLVLGQLSYVMISKYLENKLLLISINFTLNTATLPKNMVHYVFQVLCHPWKPNMDTKVDFFCWMFSSYWNKSYCTHLFRSSFFGVFLEIWELNDPPNATLGDF